MIYGHVLGTDSDDLLKRALDSEVVWRRGRSKMTCK